jgi:hypothetical protein
MVDQPSLSFDESEMSEIREHRLREFDYKMGLTVGSK